MSDGIFACKTIADWGCRIKLKDTNGLFQYNSMCSASWVSICSAGPPVTLRPTLSLCSSRKGEPGAFSAEVWRWLPNSSGWAYVCSGYLELFVLGTVRGYFLLFAFQGLSAYLSALLWPPFLDSYEFLKTHRKVPETSFAFWAQNEKHTTFLVLLYSTISSLSNLLFVTTCVE